MSSTEEETTAERPEVCEGCARAFSPDDSDATAFARFCSLDCEEEHPPTPGPAGLNIQTTFTERRMVSRVLVFPPQLARHINWQSISDDAMQMAAHFEARMSRDGTWTVTIFFSYEEGEE